MLRQEDKDFLQRKGWEWETKVVVRTDNIKETHLIVHKFKFTDKYSPQSVDMLIRFLPGYPEVGLDMFWTNPVVVLKSTGLKPDKADVMEVHDNQSWQRWSRHLGSWRPEVDNLESFFASIWKELNL